MFATAALFLPVGNQPRPGFLATINSLQFCRSQQPCGSLRTPTAADAGARLRSRPWALPSTIALRSSRNTRTKSVSDPRLRQFYEKNFQPRLALAYRPFGNSKTVCEEGFGIFTMTNPAAVLSTPPTTDVSVCPDHGQFLTRSGQPTNSQCAYARFSRPRLLVPVIFFYQNTLNRLS